MLWRIDHTLCQPDGSRETTTVTKIVVQKPGRNGNETSQFERLNCSILLHRKIDVAICVQWLWSKMHESALPIMQIVWFYCPCNKLKWNEEKEEEVNSTTMVILRNVEHEIALVILTTQRQRIKQRIYEYLSLSLSSAPLVAVSPGQNRPSLNEQSAIAHEKSNRRRPFIEHRTVSAFAPVIEFNTANFPVNKPSLVH